MTETINNRTIYLTNPFNGPVWMAAFDELDPNNAPRLLGMGTRKDSAISDLFAKEDEAKWPEVIA